MASNPYEQYAIKAAKRYGVDPRLVFAVIKQESGWNPKARSPAGAMGLMQLMPGTARGLGVDPSNWQQNIDGGVRYLSSQLKRFGRPDLALSAYNSGPGGSESSGKVEGFRETQNYVRSILANYKGGGGASATGAVGVPQPGAIGGGRVSAGPDPRRSFAMSLVEAAGQKDPNQGVEAMLGAIMQMHNDRAQQPSSVAPLAPQGQAGSVPQGGGALGGFDPDFQRRLDALVRASGGRVTVTSGYRSPEKQAQLYAAAVKKYGSEAAARKWVAPPGKSNHNRGTAADLGGDLVWAHQNAAKFGLHFPMPWENWHIEPVGSRR